jgi:hypothetical protein
MFNKGMLVIQLGKKDFRKGLQNSVLYHTTCSSDNHNYLMASPEGGEDLVA